MIEVWEHVRTSVLEYIVCMHLQLLSTASCSEVTCGYMWVIWVFFGRQACSQKTSKFPVTFWWSGAHCWCSLFSHASYRYYHISITATYCSYTHADQSSLEVARMESSGHSPSSKLLDKARFAPGISRTSGARFWWDLQPGLGPLLQPENTTRREEILQRGVLKVCSRGDTWWHQYCHVTTEMVFVALLSSPE